MDVPETRYARSGDVSIAYQVLGDGPFDLVRIPSYVSHVELAWQVPAFAEYLRRLAAFSRLITLDKRGTGMSDRVAGTASLETRMDDVRAVMDASGSEQAALVGSEDGGAMSIVFAATYPERVWGLVLAGATARSLWAPDYPWGIPEAEYLRSIDDDERRWATTEHSVATAEAWAPSANEADRRQLATMIRQSASPGAAAALRRMNMEIDVRGVLPTIRVPTLVLSMKNESPFIVQSARYLAQHIPGARHVEIAVSDPAFFAGDTEAFLRELESFLTEAWEERAWEDDQAERVLATVLFTDIVDATVHTVGLGDARWRELVEQHHDLVRRQLARFRGTEIDTAGDGFFASFDGPARAIRCACAISQGVRALGIEVRAGLHTGECERIDGKVGGIAVNIGARVAAQAGPGDVLVSSTVKDLVAGSGVRFDERGVAELKGVPGEWRLYAVEQPVT